jgi:hypothetical protein
VQEEHGGGRRLIRIRYRQRLGVLTKAFALLGIVAATVSLEDFGLSASLACLTATGIGLAAAWYSGRRLLLRLANTIDELALEMGLIRCDAQLAQSPQRGEPTCAVIPGAEAI